MLKRQDNEDFVEFCIRARSWFSARKERIDECAGKASAFLTANEKRHDFLGVQQKEKIVPDFPRNLSRFLNGENISNARLRGFSSGLWEILCETSQKRITLSIDNLHGIILADATLQLLRDLEFKRQRPLKGRDTIAEVRSRYYSTDPSGQQSNRFINGTITTLVEFGLVDAVRMERGYDVVSGPILSAFTVIAYAKFLEIQKL